MKKQLIINGTALIILCLTFVNTISKAQVIDQPGPYMTYISQQCQPIMEEYMRYSSATAHGKSAKTVDSKRQALLVSVKNAITKVSKLSPYKGDKSLRDSTVKFLKIYNIVLNEDYGKILNMEDIAEQSYDAMEAYLLAQDMANEKLKKANDDLQITEDAFAKKYEVNVVKGGDSELSEKLAKTGKVNSYYRQIYLVFFKSYKQEMYMLEAFQKKDINGIEQNKNSLLKFSTEGLTKLSSITSFNGDKTILDACKQLLEFQNMECKEKVSKLTSFYIAEDNYTKQKKAFDAKKENQRTQADVDQFNKAVNEYNEAANSFNAINNELNNKRNTLISNWNKAIQNFFDKHVPKYK